MIRLTKPEKQIAEEDIKCYVLLRDDNYELPWANIEIGQEIEITKIKDCIGYFGYSSYKYLADLERFVEYLGGDKTNLTIQKAIIPKGSEYYEGVESYSFSVCKEYVELFGFISNRLEIKKEKEID